MNEKYLLEAIIVYKGLSLITWNQITVSKQMIKNRNNYLKSYNCV